MTQHCLAATLEDLRLLLAVRELEDRPRGVGEADHAGLDVDRERLLPGAGHVQAGNKAIRSGMVLYSQRLRHHPVPDVLGTKLR